ncbi:MAG: aminopeptidase N [Planctomycetota bacterium]|jgi:aminopeptidase N
MIILLTCAAAALVVCQTSASTVGKPVLNTSGGVLLEEQACYDVQHYLLELEVMPARRAVEGQLTMTASVRERAREIALHLDPALTIDGVFGEIDGAWKPLEYARPAGVIFIQSGALLAKSGAEFRVQVRYSGKPRIAPNPPWDGGFTWSESGGKPWFVTSCQGEGGDIWWPCKDHPSDKPETMDLRFTVPEGLVIATNGAHVKTETTDGKTTSEWHVSTPIANYAVALNVGPYVELKRTMDSVAGDTIPIHFWVLEGNEEKGTAFLDEIVDHLAFFEDVCGPYPFRGDKYGVVETPHLGMEHQSIIAYGNKFKGDPNFDYDWLHHHELAHEWWGNLVTAKDWADFWIHEGIGTYMQPLYLERKFGREAYERKMKIDLLRVLNKAAMAPRPPRTTDSIYFAQTGGDAPAGDIYFKGSWVCHSLRWLLGDETFFKVLRRWAYPDPALENTTDGSATRFATTAELQAIAEEVSGRKLAWFFDVYVRRGPLPKLIEERDGATLRLSWEAPDGLPFPMPVEVAVDGEPRRVDVPKGGVTLDVGKAKVRVDPSRLLLHD